MYEKMQDFSLILLHSKFLIASWKLSQILRFCQSISPLRGIGGEKRGCCQPRGDGRMGEAKEIRRKAPWAPRDAARTWLAWGLRACMAAQSFQLLGLARIPFGEAVVKGECHPNKFISAVSVAQIGVVEEGWIVEDQARSIVEVDLADPAELELSRSYGA